MENESRAQSFKRPRRLANEEAESVDDAAAREDVRALINRCPFCHVDLQVESERWVACARCLARHHDSCWDEGGQCGSCASPDRLAPVEHSSGAVAAKLTETKQSSRTGAHQRARQRSQLRLKALAFFLPMVVLLLSLLFLLTRESLNLHAILPGVVPQALFIVGLFAFGLYHAQKRRRLQRKVAVESQPIQAGWQSFAVNYQPGSAFRSQPKATWPITGLLALGPDCVTFTIPTQSGSAERRFSPADSTIEWFGTDFPRNGLTSWFVVKQGTKLHYFSADAGVFHSNEATTRAIYERLVAPRPGSDSGEC